MIDKTKLTTEPLYSPTIIIDFDGTICEFEFPEMGKPKKGVQEALEKLRSKGYKILIHSVRTNSCWQYHKLSNDFSQEKEIEKIQKYMKKHNLYYDYICMDNKPLAMYYIDDRAIHFDDTYFFDDWPMIAKRIPKPESRGQIQNIRKESRKC